MPAEKNTALRVFVPILLLVVAVVTVWGIYSGGKPKPAAATPNAATTPAPPPAAPTAPVASTGSPASSAQDGSVPPKAASAPAAAPAGTPLTGLRARVVAVPLTTPAPIGSIDPSAGFAARYTFSHLGAGVETITLARHYETLKDKIKDQQRFRVQQPLGATGSAGEAVTTLSLAARAVIIDGTPIDLFGNSTTNYWTETAPGAFSAEIVDAAGATIARVTRVFTLQPGSYEVEVRQSFENVSGRDLKVQWVQYGPLDIHEELFGYQLDTRRIRYGYLFDQTRDPSQSIVSADTLLEGHAAPIAAADARYNARQNLAERNALLFPRPSEFKGAGDLVWVAQTSRYFAFACHPLLPDGAARPERFLLANEVYAVPLGWGKQARLALEMHSSQVEVKQGGAQDLSFAAYAGPLAKSFLSEKADPSFGVLGLSQMVVFNLGGCCAPCTFQWLAKLLLWYLELVHGILGDWTVAIILLVFTVRATLHPITRRSQINMTRFGKKMAALAPKQKKLQEQYKNDPKQMQVEMARLMREEGVSPTQALGCIPMFLQTPVWMALYAMLFFAFQFRHQPGFYGVFQAATGGNWSFLADLSAPDHFFEFGTSFHIPLISTMMGDISGINLLPLVLGVVFWIQQKYLTPPTTTVLTPEQEMQQKMMKVMMVVMFPVMMYNAPSGLAVYFITNSILGIIESRWIRAHIDELDKNPPPAPPGSKPGAASVKPGNSIWDRVQAAAEQRKKVENEAAQKKNKPR
ncbi:MAG: membrane protein insertase YidC [Phycisphaerales bacterium]